jgi:zinc protease
MKGDRIVATGASVQPNKTLEAIKEIHRELQDFATSRRATSDEVATAAQLLPQANPAVLEPLEMLSRIVREVVTFDLKEDYIGSYIAHVRRLRAADIHRAAKLLFSDLPAAWLVVGDASQLQANLKQLELGELTVVDDESELLRHLDEPTAELRR